MTRIVALLFFLGMPVLAQDNIVTERGGGALLRTLDRITGEVIDYEIPNGGEIMRARIRVQVEECRFPKEDLASDAYARITIFDNSVTEPMFDGWMVASSPALSSLEHPRYDVWVLACMAA